MATPKTERQRRAGLRIWTASQPTRAAEERIRSGGNDDSTGRRLRIRMGTFLPELSAQTATGRVDDCLQRTGLPV